MSGFLATLAAKALDQAPVVRPRLRSFFEPPGPVSFGDLWEPVERLEETERLPEPAQERPERGSAAPLGPPTVPPHVERLIVTERQAAPPPVRTIPSYPPIPPRHAPSVTERVSERPGSREIERLSTVKASTVERIINAPPEPRRESQRAEPPLRIERETRARVPETRAAAPDLRPAKSPVAALPAKPQRPELPHTRQAAQAKPLAAGGAQFSRAEPTPEVHITIGRIEVRAMMAAAPATPRVERRTPQVSLEEYLRQREGVRR